MKLPRRMWLSASLASCLVAVLAASAAQQYTFTPAGNFPGASYTIPTAINRTHIVGYFSGSRGSLAYIQTGKQFIAPKPSGAIGSYFTGINNQEVAVGGWCTVSCGGLTASTGYTYNFNTGAIATFYHPSAPTGTVPYGISDSGTIVGGYCPGAQGCPPGPVLATIHAFLLSNGTYTSYDYPDPLVVGTQFNAINKSGTIVGWYQTDHTQHGFIFKNGTWTLLDFPGANSTFPHGINNSGEISGYYLDANFNVRGFSYQNGTFSEVNVPINWGTSTGVGSVNDLGVLVGSYVPYPGQGMPYESFKAAPAHSGSASGH